MIHYYANIIACTYTNLGGSYYIPSWFSLLFFGYKPVQHVTIVNTVGNGNTTIFAYQNISKHKRGTVKLCYKR